MSYRSDARFIDYRHFIPPGFFFFFHDRKKFPPLLTMILLLYKIPEYFYNFVFDVVLFLVVNFKT